jgi:hypothetical protein
VDGISSPTQDFACPAVLAGHWGYHGCDGGAILAKSQEEWAPVQDGSPRVYWVGCLLGMCMDLLVAYAAPTSPAYFHELTK